MPPMWLDLHIGFTDILLTGAQDGSCEQCKTGTEQGMEKIRISFPILTRRLLSDLAHTPIFPVLQHNRQQFLGRCGRSYIGYSTAATLGASSVQLGTAQRTRQPVPVTEILC